MIDLLASDCETELLKAKLQNGWDWRWGALEGGQHGVQKLKRKA